MQIMQDHTCTDPASEVKTFKEPKDVRLYSSNFYLDINLDSTK